MPRYFTLDQAHRMLPHVEDTIRRAIELKAEYQSHDEQIRDVTRKVMISGGMMIDREKFVTLKNSRDEAGSAIRAAIEAVQETGCLVKDLDIGLLDFPTLYNGQEVYLCWRLGEKRIEYWHGIEEGFRGRKPIDAEFLNNHRGDAVS
jgi:hypothetical protein